MKNNLKSKFSGITFKVVLGLLIFDGILLSSIVVLMNTLGKDLVKKETSKLVEQTGNNLSLSLHNRLKEVESLARSLANIGEEFVGKEISLKIQIPNMINFDNDLDIAGGGLWYEPLMFDGKTTRKSFFWGRGENNELTFFNDYNAPGLKYDENKFLTDPDYKKRFLKAPGYHNEEWYVVVKHLKEKQNSFWSRSYMDPYTFQPMVTVTVPMRNKKGVFIGVSTIDLKLDGLKTFTKKWSEKLGGYIFILDRNNKFLSFPIENLSKRIEKDEKGKVKLEEFYHTNEFAKNNNWFKDINKTLHDIESKMLSESQKSSSYNKDLIKIVDNSSYQIDQVEASFISAVLARPYESLATNFLSSTTFENDYILKEKSVASMFHVPDSYWKVVLVKPYSSYVAVANNIRDKILSIILVIVLTLFTVACIYQIIFVVRPLKMITSKVEEIIGELKKGKKISEMTDIVIKDNLSGEIEQLALGFNDLTTSLQKAEHRLKRRSEAVLSATHEMANKNVLIDAVESAAIHIFNEFEDKDSQKVEITLKNKKDYVFREYIEKNKELVMVSEEMKFFKDDFTLFEKNEIKVGTGVLIIPLNLHNKPLGMIKIHGQFDDLNPEDFFFLEAIVESLILSIENIIYVNNMEELISERTKELEETQKQLLDVAHQAGKAEIAVGVLHNIGNAITPLLTSTIVLKEHFQKSSVIKKFKQLNDLLAENKENLNDFLINDEKGKKVPGFLLSFLPELVKEVDSAEGDLTEMSESLHHIREIILAQNAIARGKTLVEDIHLNDLFKSVQEAIKKEFDKHDIILDIQLDQNLPKINSSKGKIIQVINNLIINAKDACLENTSVTENEIKCFVINNGHTIDIIVEDNGIGINPEKSKEIFNFGYTTKEHGHGFGLHSSFNLAKELGGDLSVTSSGPNKGARFVFSLPLKLAA